MRLLALDSLRGVGSLVVVAHHLTVLGFVYYLPWIRHADPLLEFFFIISGFVMAMIYGEKINDRRDLGGFLVRRIGRAWPLHALMLFVMIGIEAARAAMMYAGVWQSDYPAFTGGTSVESIFANLLLVQSLGPDKLHTWNYPSWTISTEITAYIIMAVMTLAVNKPWRIPVAIGICLYAAAMFYRQTFGWVDHNVISLSRCVMGFFFGYVLFHAWRRWPIRTRTTGTAVETLAVVMAATAMTTGLPGLWYPLSHVAFGLIVYAFACEKGALSDVLKLRPFTWIGERSFSIYMVHVSIVVLLIMGARAWRKLTGHEVFTYVLTLDGREKEVISFASPLAMNLLTLTYFGAVLLCGALLYRWVEAPSRDYFSALANRKFGRAGAAGVSKPHGAKSKTARSRAHSGGF